MTTKGSAALPRRTPSGPPPPPPDPAPPSRKRARTEEEGESGEAAASGAPGVLDSAVPRTPHAGLTAEQQRLCHLCHTIARLQPLMQWLGTATVTPAVWLLVQTVTLGELQAALNVQMTLAWHPWEERTVLTFLGFHACLSRAMAFQQLRELEKRHFVDAWLGMYARLAFQRLQAAVAALSQRPRSANPVDSPAAATPAPAAATAATAPSPAAALPQGAGSLTPASGRSPPPPTPQLAPAGPPRGAAAAAAAANSPAASSAAVVGVTAASATASAAVSSPERYVALSPTPTNSPFIDRNSEAGQRGDATGPALPLPPTPPTPSPPPPRPTPPTHPRVEMVLQQEPCPRYSERCCYYCCLGNAAACLFLGDRLVPSSTLLPTPRTPDPPRSWMTAEEQQRILELHLEQQPSPARPRLVGPPQPPSPPPPPPDPLPLPQPPTSPCPSPPFAAAASAAVAAEEPEEDCISRRTRRALRPPTPVVPKTSKVAFICGKADDWYDMYDDRLLGPDEDFRLQSDKAAARIVGAKCPHMDVLICKPRSVSDLRRRFHAQLLECDVIHVLESEQFLNNHNYLLYQGFFDLLRQYGSRVVPSLETMSFIMSKADYLKVLQDHGIPHIPTCIVPRPRRKKDWVDAVRQMSAWMTQQGVAKVVTKPSHSGTRTDLRFWDVQRLMRPEPHCDAAPSDRQQFAEYLQQVFHHKHKPYLFLQAFVPDLAEAEHRLYYFLGEGGRHHFKACIRTQWVYDGPDQREGAEMLRSSPVSDKEVLQACRAVADRVVPLLPQDSVMYRVDLFHDRATGGWVVNEVEMVDACLLPDFHPNQVEELAEALITYQPTQAGRSSRMCLSQVRLAHLFFGCISQCPVPLWHSVSAILWCGGLQMLICL